jgi:hypothetical protein
MIEVIDRIPTHPGRVKLTPVEGQENTFDMVRADEPIEVGTPINKALFDSYAEMISAVAQNVDNRVFELSQRVKVGSLTDGSLFGLYENGVLVPYIKVQNAFRTGPGYNEYTNALVVRLDCVARMSLYESAQAPIYAGSAIDSWLENEFYNTLDAATQGVMPTVYVQYTNTSGGLNTILRKVFILSLTEYGYDEPAGFGDAGSNMLYFSNGGAGRRISTYNGSPVKHYTRTVGRSTGLASVLNESGNTEVVSETTVAGVRPAFLLPLTFEVTAGVPSTKNVMATAEVI